MLIYKDIFCGDELCSDSYPMKKLYNGAIMEVNGGYISIDGGIDESLIGGNASAEGEDAGAGAQDSSTKGINVVLTHKLSETAFTKKDFKTYMKTFLKKTMTYLKENGKEDQIDAFKAGATEAMKKIMEEFKEWSFFTGESMDPEACIVLCGYREDGITPYFWYFTHSLEEEKF